jgi:hypothetical protein
VIDLRFFTFLGVIEFSFSSGCLLKKLLAKKLTMKMMTGCNNNKNFLSSFNFRDDLWMRIGWQDETRAEFSRLEVAECMTCTREY